MAGGAGERGWALCFAPHPQDRHVGYSLTQMALVSQTLAVFRMPVSRVESHTAQASPLSGITSSAPFTIPHPLSNITSTSSPPAHLCSPSAGASYAANTPTFQIRAPLSDTLPPALTDAYTTRSEQGMYRSPAPLDGRRREMPGPVALRGIRWRFETRKPFCAKKKIL